eukprot:scaffold15750_cov110-Isochrysis_galbana.AAC.4
MPSAKALMLSLTLAAVSSSRSNSRRATRRCCWPASVHPSPPSSLESEVIEAPGPPVTLNAARLEARTMRSLASASASPIRSACVASHPCTATLLDFSAVVRSRGGEGLWAPVGASAGHRWRAACTADTSKDTFRFREGHDFSAASARR